MGEEEEEGWVLAFPFDPHQWLLALGHHLGRRHGAAFLLWHSRKGQCQSTDHAAQIHDMLLDSWLEFHSRKLAVMAGGGGGRVGGGNVFLQLWFWLRLEVGGRRGRER